VVTSLGLVFAVLTERVRWATAFKILVFMPMAVSGLASGIIFRLVYEQDPAKGVANAVVVSVHDTFVKSSAYPGARTRDDSVMAAQNGAYVTKTTYGPGDVVLLGLVGYAPAKLKDAGQAAAPASEPGTLGGAVWLDFAPGGQGKPGAIDEGEKALSGVRVQALSGGKVVATTKTHSNGEFSFTGLPNGNYTLQLPSSNFTEPFNGVTWLGPTLITASIIAAYVWMWAGFAMVLIAAGLAAIPRDALEAARVDGATEWQVFRRVTIPLLSPVLVVVLVTLIINVLKIFDLVLVIAPGSVQADANVLALQMWTISFGGGNDQGMGSALGVFLFLLVLPAMIFNIRRFRREQL
jgi:alpha-glucoside transport system permease protein